jgi:aerobic-type carbon monoxide dehydrogenase small subunit (CoxS/CutS family)
LKEVIKVKEEASKYLCPYCRTQTEGFEELKAHVVEQHKDAAVPLPEGMIRLRVNGQDYQIHVEPEWTLNYLIHDKMGLTSPKMFCDRGACGSCTVIMNGRPILSCMSLAIECDGKTIETAEGIADAGHPLIESYVKHHCMQCGYCTPGFVTTAKALLDRNPNPTEEQIVEALGGNLCRCGTYPQHPKAIREAAQSLAEKGGA